MWRTPPAAPPIGLGCMRLSTEPDRDEARALALLHTAFDAGITLLDTADSYCWDDTEIGRNERLIGRALATWPGDRSSIAVATKGGLTRPGGRWVADGRARHLAAACEASLRALDVNRIQLYQLHAPDPRTPLATSLRALASLRQHGLVDEVGLCNVTVGQIEEARRITDIRSVQVELSIWHDDNLLNGVVEYCIANGITLVAHRPVGGPKRRRRTQTDPVLLSIARRHDATPFEIALAWLADLSPLVVPIPGATRVETISSIARVRAIALTGHDRALLDERFPAGHALGFRGRTRDRLAPLRTDGEVVLIMGLPAAGKSTLAQAFVARGYHRLNRDETGGSLADLLPALDSTFASGASRIVLDNTYVSRKSRAAVVQRASASGLPVRCVWLSTGVEEAQTNAVARMVSRHGRLLAAEEIRAASTHDPGAFGPGVQFRYQRALEPPGPSEGFSTIEIVEFERRPEVAGVNRALIVWCDDVLWRSRSGRRAPASAEDVEILSGRGDILRRHEADGWRLLGLSWQPDIADGTVSAADVETAIARLRQMLGVAIEVEYCPHAAGPPVCWCRKPLPGLGVLFIHRHRLDPSRCLYIGNGPQDPGFARRLRVPYQEADQFFANGGPARA